MLVTAPDAVEADDRAARFPPENPPSTVLPPPVTVPNASELSIVPKFPPSG